MLFNQIGRATMEWGWLIGVESVPTWAATIKRIRRHLPAACDPPSNWATPFDPLVVHYTLLGWLFAATWPTDTHTLSTEHTHTQIYHT